MATPGGGDLTHDEVFHRLVAKHFNFVVNQDLALNARIGLDRWKEQKAFVDEVTRRWRRPKHQGLQVPLLGEGNSHS